MSDGNTDSASQDTIWDLEMDSISDFTNTALLHMIPIHSSPGGNSGSHCTSPSSALSSAPSGLLTPTIGTTTGDGEYATRSERGIYEKRRKVRKSWVYFQKTARNIPLQMEKSDGVVLVVSIYFSFHSLALEFLFDLSSFFVVELHD